MRVSLLLVALTVGVFWRLHVQQSEMHLIREALAGTGVIQAIPRRQVQYLVAPFTATASFAFATICNSDLEVDNLLLIGYKILQLSSLVSGHHCDMVLLTSTHVSIRNIARLREVGWRQYPLQPSSLFAYEDEKLATKLNVFGLTSYSRVVFLSNAVLPVVNIDPLFEVLPVHEVQTYKIAAPAHPEQAWTSDVMVVVPQQFVYDELVLQLQFEFIQYEDDDDSSVYIRHHGGPLFRKVDEVIQRYFQSRTKVISEKYCRSEDRWGTDLHRTAVVNYHDEFKPWYNRDDVRLSHVRKDFTVAFRKWWENYEEFHMRYYAKRFKGNFWGPRTWHNLSFDPNWRFHEPTSRSHAWLFRGTALEYTQPLYSLFLASLDLSGEDLILEAAGVAESCNEVCAKRQEVCWQRALAFSAVNNCNTIRRYFNCTSCTMDLSGSDQPSFKPSSGQCLINSLFNPAAFPSCGATDPHTARLCPCVPQDDPSPRAIKYPGYFDSDPGWKVHFSNDTYEDHRSGCIPWDTGYTAQRDASCVRYLQNASKIVSILPLAVHDIRSDTVKFMAHYPEPAVQAVLQFSQKRSIVEPASEVVSYHVDRLLGIRMVPPTTWVTIKLKALRQAVQGTADLEYMVWIDDVFFRALDKLGLVRVDVDGDRVVTASAQLWLTDTHPINYSVFNVPQDWPQYFVGGRKLPLPDGLPLLALSDVAVLDFVLGLPDRSARLYVAGGCVSRCKRSHRTGKPHQGAPTLVLSDNKGAFRTDSNPDPHPISRALRSEPPRFCLFRRATRDRLKALQNKLVAEVQKQLPSAVYQQLEAPLQSAQRRLSNLLAMVQLCVQAHGEDAVVPWA